MITKIERAQFTSAEQAKSIRPITYIDRERKIELRYDTLAELIMYYDIGKHAKTISVTSAVLMAKF